jgi:hypothetical protein
MLRLPFMKLKLLSALFLLLAGPLGLAANGTATDIDGLDYTGTNTNGSLLAGGATDPLWKVTYADVYGVSYTGNSQYTGAAYVIDDSPYISSEGYVQNTSTAQWITAPGAATDTNGDSPDTGGNYLPGNGTTGTNSAEYIYTMTFSITGSGSGTVKNDVQISLTIAADDAYAIYVNPGAVNTNTHSSTYGSFISSTASDTGTSAWNNTSVTYLQNYSASSTELLDAGFVIGTNTISIIVTNSNGITGTSGSTVENASGLFVYQVGAVGLINGNPVPEAGAWLPIAGALGLFGVLAWRRKHGLGAVAHRQGLVPANGWLNGRKSGTGSCQDVGWGGKGPIAAVTAASHLTAMSQPNFAEVFCARYAMEPAAFERSVLRRVLYPHARLLAPLCRFFNPDFFAADLDFIHAVSGVCQGHHFSVDAMDFSDHPANQGFWRRTLRVRVSVRRLFILIQQTLPPPPEARLVTPDSYGEF